MLDTNPHAYEILSYGNVAQLLQDGIVLHTFNIGGTGQRSIASPATFECNSSGGSTTICQINVPEVGVFNFDPGAFFGIYGFDGVWFADGGRTVYFGMSHWLPYNVFWHRVDLVRAEDPA